MKIKLLKKVHRFFIRVLYLELNQIKRLAGEAAILASNSNSKSFNKLWDSEVKVNSQWGEDGILNYICNTIKVSKPRILEIGVGDFKECNSRFLIEMRNASAVLVDSNLNLVENLKKSNLEWKTHIMAVREWVTPDNVNNIVSKARKFLSGIDILSLDLDGNDYWILKEIDLESVKVIVVEYNPIFGSTAPLTVPRKDDFNRTNAHFSNLYWGASIVAFNNLLGDKDYKLIGSNRVGCNAFFVKAEFHKLFNNLDPVIFSELVDWRVRESRDINGKKTYLSSSDSREAIKDCLVENISTGEILKLKNAT
jgi:hypothetical protein